MRGKEGLQQLEVEVTVPPQFKCPISLELMKDPVTMCTGITYDRHAIEKWLDAGNNVCPVTNQRLHAQHLIPNHTLRRLIQQWCLANRFNGIQRIPTPTAPLDSAQLTHILSAISKGEAQAVEKLASLAAESHRNRKCIASAPDTAPILTKVLIHHHQSLRICEHALAVLAAVLPISDGRARVLLASSDALRCITTILHGSNLEGRSNAASIIKELAADGEYRQRIGAADGLAEGLVRLVKESTCPATTKSGLTAVYLIAGSGKTRVKLVEGGAIPVVLEILPEAERGVCERDGFQPQSPADVLWRDGSLQDAANSEDLLDLADKIDWESVAGLQETQKRALRRLTSRGVYWKHPSKSIAALFTLFHGGDVEADGNCLYSAAQKAMRLKNSPQELRRRAVKRFSEDYEAGVCAKEQTDAAIKHLYVPDLDAGWGVHIVQDVKLLARKADREALDASINELVQVGVSREAAAEAIYKERCISIEDGCSWAKYMSVTGNFDDEYDIITLQYTQEGLLTVDENREGHAAAFGDDIAIESLATEFKREIYVVQAHGTDAMAEEENCVFFLPHTPRSQVSCPPVFLFMKGTGWCGAGADHYEPLIACTAPVASQEKAAIVL